MPAESTKPGQLAQEQSGDKGRHSRHETDLILKMKFWMGVAEPASPSSLRGDLREHKCSDAVTLDALAMKRRGKPFQER